MMIILHCQISGKYHVITSIYATLIVAFNPNMICGDNVNGILKKRKLRKIIFNELLFNLNREILWFNNF